MYENQQLFEKLWIFNKSKQQIKKKNYTQFCKTSKYVVDEMSICFGKMSEICQAHDTLTFCNFFLNICIGHAGLRNIESWATFFWNANGNLPLDLSFAMVA